MNIIPWVALAVVVAVMVVELFISRRNERRLRAEGAVEPGDDVYRLMRVVYPGCFIAMTVEGSLHGILAPSVLVVGLLVLVGSKALKAWVIAALGANWSFHVLVRRVHPLVTRGPYRYLRHPNYLAVVGEIVGFAILVDAPVAGVISLSVMGPLIAKRIAVEERALGLRA